jgi:Transposase DDE domain group 1
MPTCISSRAVRRGDEPWLVVPGRSTEARRPVFKQLKGDYALGSIPTRHFFANQTYFHLLLLAYNLVNWFKRFCLPPELQTATLQTRRPRVLLMPAQLTRAQNRPRLVLPASGPGEAAWTYALQRIDSLRP